MLRAACAAGMMLQFKCLPRKLSVPFAPPARRAWSSIAQEAKLAPQMALPPDSDIEHAIRVGSALAGRHLSEAKLQSLCERLRSNWFSSASDVAAMTEDECVSIGFPLRLKNTIADAIGPSDGDVAGLDTPLLPVTWGGDVNEHMESRICPPLDRFGFRISDVPRVVARGKITKYSLSKSELSPGLVDELDKLFKFGTERFYGAQADPIAAVTAQKYGDHLRGMLGWMVNVLGEDVESLSLRTLVPSADRDGVIPTFNYSQWLVKERQIAVRTELLVLRSILYMAKYLYHSESQIVAGGGDRPYADIAVVRELRALINSRRKASKVAPRVSDEAAKWLDYPAYLALTRELKRETGCLKMLASGEVVRRTEDSIAWSLQKYLIFAILACVPDRQRTLRELKLGRTLFKEGDVYVIRHKPDDYKTGKAYGERAPLYISPSLTVAMDDFISTYRAALEPDHDFLFTQTNGQPLTDKSLYKVFWTTSYRLTGKRLTPHYVRDVIVTHLRSQENASERDLEALAIYMGHSIAIQKSTYDRRSLNEKVQPAVRLLESLQGL